MMRLVYRNTVLLIASAVLAAGAGCKAKEPVVEKPVAAPTDEVGGQKIVKLVRPDTATTGKPEFTSATLFPGRGMNLYQITATIPGKGSVEVLASPAIADGIQTLDKGDDAYGNKSFSFGGAFLVPFANRIRGTYSAGDKTVTATWKGKTITLPANWIGKNPGAEPHAMHGLMLNAKSDSVDTQTLPDGGVSTAVYHEGNFGGHWPSQTDVTISTTLTGPYIEATVTAKNVGTEPEPMGIGWHPYFNLPSGKRDQAKLYISGDQRAEVNNYDDVFPTGKLLPVKGTPYDFTKPGGSLLPDKLVDDNWVHLKTDRDGVSYSEIIDPAAGYGVRITARSPQVKSVQAYSPTTKSFIALEPQFNYGDPFGKQWKGQDAGMFTLKPGESVVWKVRLELFVPGSEPTSAATK